MLRNTSLSALHSGATRNSKITNKKHEHSGTGSTKERTLVYSMRAEARRPCRLVETQLGAQALGESSFPLLCTDARMARRVP